MTAKKPKPPHPSREPQGLKRKLRNWWYYESRTRIEVFIYKDGKVVSCRIPWTMLNRSRSRCVSMSRKP